MQILDSIRVGNGEAVRKNSPVVQGFVWLRRNLFATPFDACLTLFCLWVIYQTVPALLGWAIFDANLRGEDRSSCTSGGACWVFVKERIGQFLFGFYPSELRWRPLLFLGTVSTGLLLVALLPKAKARRLRQIITGVLLLGSPLFGYVLLYGGIFGLTVVDTPKWGGLLLTLVIAATGIVGSLPLGIFLALGRRSQMPVIQKLCVVFIEFWRGVPLITVLFMASVMLPLFLPEGVTFDKLLRALVGVTLFSSAYIAEVVRGGLQAIPVGQYEAAKALGLSYWHTMGLIVLPQALRKVIPGIVNTFIGLFKDTTLVLIIGMFDLLGIVQAAATDPEWLGYATEGYVFAGLVFWIFCFSMSRYSMRLERRLGGENHG